MDGFSFLSIQMIKNLNRTFEKEIYIFKDRQSKVKGFKWGKCYAKNFEFLIQRGLETFNQKSFEAKVEETIKI